MEEGKGKIDIKSQVWVKFRNGASHISHDATKSIFSLHISFMMNAVNFSNTEIHPSSQQCFSAHNERLCEYVALTYSSSLFCGLSRHLKLQYKHQFAAGVHVFPSRCSGMHLHWKSEIPTQNYWLPTCNRLQHLAQPKAYYLRHYAAVFTGWAVVFMTIKLTLCQLLFLNLIYQCVIKPYSSIFC